MPRPNAAQRAIRLRDRYTCRDCGHVQGQVVAGQGHCVNPRSVVRLFTWPIGLIHVADPNPDDYITVCATCWRKRQQVLLWSQPQGEGDGGGQPLQGPD